MEKGAAGAEIKKAYHRSAMKHHPDKGGDPDKFKEIQEASKVGILQHLHLTTTCL